MRLSPRDFVMLCKPRICLMVVVSSLVGFFLGSATEPSATYLSIFVIGTMLSASGAAMLNAFLERDFDSRMERTRSRITAQGVVEPADILVFGTLLTLAGTGLLAAYVNVLTAFLSLLTAFLYVTLYTPLKRVTWLNTLVGAVPGALPPVGGWAAAEGDLSLGAWVLFAILYVWQLPHFYAIAWMYKHDYEEGGFKMLSHNDENASRTVRHMLACLFVLIPVSLLPSLTGISGVYYLLGAMLLGGYFLAIGISFRRRRDASTARRVLTTSIIYLPALFILMAIDRL